MFRIERRHHERVDIRRPVKVRSEMTGRYLAGGTINVSPCGVMIRLDAPGSLLPGERVRLGICQSRNQALLLADDLAPATVVRSARTESGCAVAIAFDHEQRLLNQAA